MLMLMVDGTLMRMTNNHSYMLFLPVASFVCHVTATFEGLSNGRVDRGGNFFQEKQANRNIIINEQQQQQQQQQQPTTTTNNDNDDDDDVDDNENDDDNVNG